MLKKSSAVMEVAESQQTRIYITPEARHILENARSEARRMHDSKTGTEHILLAMVRETSAVASRLLSNTGSISIIYTHCFSRAEQKAAQKRMRIFLP
jgi:ATP-dependent Clp protease ATP-binding subunit ClpC